MKLRWSFTTEPVRVTAMLLGLLSLPASAFDVAEEVDVPAGFAIEQVAEVPNARAMVWGDDGTLFVSTMVKGKVYGVTGLMEGEPVVWPIGNKLRIPNGVAFHDGALYVAETTRVIRFDGIEGRLDSPPEPEVVIDELPGGRQHGWKYIGFGPDGKLYVTIGVPCNVCDEDGYGLIVRFDPDGSNREVVARGVRNSVGFDWHPETGELWFTDNGRDLMGDDIPPCELNRVAQVGDHFGFPFCHGADIAEPDAAMAALGSCSDAVAPAQELGPHVAPLGIAIYDGDQFPPEYRGQVFVAEHGSWNRSEKIGYRVTRVDVAADGRRSLGYDVFAEGWLEGERAVGRPVDLVVAPDGSLLLSDDKRGAIYRISYTD